MLKLLRFFITTLFLLIGINNLKAQLFKKKYYPSIHNGQPLSKKQYKAEKRKAKKAYKTEIKAKKKSRKEHLSKQTRATRKRLKASRKQTEKQYRKKRRKSLFKSK